MPPTERRGRVHSSTVTVAVLPIGKGASLPRANAPDGPRPLQARRPDGDFEASWFGGTVKAGGQHRNKHANSVRLTHRPSGLVETRQGRKRDANMREARAALEERLDALEAEGAHRERAALTRTQVGSGERGDKVVTLRFQADQAIHHGTGRSISASRWMAGHMDELWI